MAKVFASVGGAFSYAVNNTFKKPAQWFLIAVVCILEYIALLVGLLYLGLGILVSIIGDAVSTAITNILETIPGLNGIADTLLSIFPLNNAGGLIAIGIIGLLIFLLFSFFLGGIQVKIFAGRDVTFSGFFGTVGRGFQFLVLTIIYDIIVIAVMVGVGLAVAAGTNLANVTDIFGLLVAIGIWLIVVLVLALFFAIFKYPALVNFSRQGKFAAAFHFKEIGAMIGATKWYKILLGVIINYIVLIVLGIVLSLICTLLRFVPGIAGIILSFIVLALGSVFIFFGWTNYYAKLIENKA